VFTARVHSRVRTVNTAVFRVCLYGRVPCSRACLRKVYTAVNGLVPRIQTVYTAVECVHSYSRRYTRSVHGRVQGPYTAVEAVKTTVCTVHGGVWYTTRAPPCTRYVHGRARPCTQAIKTTVCTVRGRAHGRVRVMYGQVPGPYTP